MTDTGLPWRIAGRIIRPYALAVSLATLVIVWSITTESEEATGEWVVTLDADETPTASSAKPTSPPTPTTTGRSRGFNLRSGARARASSTTTSLTAVPQIQHRNTAGANLSAVVSSGLTTGAAYLLVFSGTNGYLGFSADI